MGLKGFNLLTDNITPPDIWDKIYNWVTNVGRVVVILIELVVIVSFGVRIVVDTQAKNLIEQEQDYSTTLLGFKQRELAFLDMKERFASFRQIQNTTTNYTSAINEIMSTLPNNIENITISVKDVEVTVQGRALSNDVVTLESTLKSSASFRDVQVFEIEQTTNRSGLSGGANSQVNFGIKIFINDDKLMPVEQI